MYFGSARVDSMLLLFILFYFILVWFSLVYFSFSFFFLLILIQQLFFCFFKDFNYLFSERGKGKEKEGERNIIVQEKHPLGASCTQPGPETWPIAHVCALTRNWTGNLLVCGRMPKPQESGLLIQFLNQKLSALRHPTSCSPASAANVAWLLYNSAAAHHARLPCIVILKNTPLIHLAECPVSRVPCLPLH